MLDAEWIQGDFSPGKVSVVLTFQVNCPGCFKYALPAFNEVARDDALAALGLRCALVATAFEDYELNTRDNLQALIRDGVVVGETKRAYELEAGAGGGGGGGGEAKCPLDFSGLTIGWDALAVPTEESRERLAAALMEQLAGKAPKAVLRNAVQQHLASRTMSAPTFDLNSMQGTPTWAILDGDMRVVQQATGHLGADELKAFVGRLLRGEEPGE